MSGSTQNGAPAFTPGIAVFHDKYWSRQWLVICGLCRDDGMAQPFGQDEAAALEWATTHQEAHARDPLRGYHP
jgi:hypothetical protein